MYTRLTFSNLCIYFSFYNGTINLNNSLYNISHYRPLDLCDATASSPDVLSLGYQSPNASMLPNSNQGNVAPMLPASGVTSTSAVPGSNFSSASSQINASVR